jgi:hypothetical protein
VIALSDSNKEVTREMIEAAKEYPFEKLYHFTGRKCACPFHEDRDTSMKLYSNNTVHCFSCRKSWDTIEFIRKLEELSFLEAVKKLQ